MKKECASKRPVGWSGKRMDFDIVSFLSRSLRECTSDGRVMGVIEVSRSIGDGRFKHCGVTCIPDVTKFEITDKDKLV